MELKKLVLATAVFGALGGLYGCSGDESATITIEGDIDNSVNDSNNEFVDGGVVVPGDDNDDFRPDDAAAIAAAIAASPGAFERPVSVLNPETGDVVTRTSVVLPAVILDDLTLDSDVIYTLNGRVTVGNGNQEMSAVDGVLEDGEMVDTAVLTIEPGTLILGAAGQSVFANLLITRGSQIFAMGTADAPIIMASEDPNFDGSGEWGGLIIHGYGQHNNCNYVDLGNSGITTDEACNISAEGESGLAGGHTFDDNSGVLNYVVVAEGGIEFAPDDEINGISLVAVGSGTEMDFIQVHNNSDDGIEFFGGDVNVSHLVLTGNQDDSVDWDEGFTGNLQYVLVQQTPASGGTTIEADTEGTTDFLSEPTIVNATFIADGTGPSVGHALRASSGGYIHNSIITSASGVLGACLSLGGTGSQTNAQDGSIVYNQVIADCTNLEVDAAEITVETTNLEDNGNATSIFAVAANLDSNLASMAAEATGVAAADVTVSPVAEPDFFDATDFIGAINPDGSDIWYEGWIIPGSLN